MVNSEIVDLFLSLSDSKTADQTRKFFKTKEGQYGYRDNFLGIKMKTIRGLAKKYGNIEFKIIEELLQSKYHEVRSFALVVLVDRYKKSPVQTKKMIYDIYITNTKNINNWDLVDISAHHIVGEYTFSHDRNVLNELSFSEDLWERRIAIVSTWYYIKNGNFDKTFEIALNLMDDKQDLIHKSVGWMLREVGKLNIEKERDFLLKHYEYMPRTMLRYAIEKFPETERQGFLKGNL